jgi:hypothetical protein
MVYEASTRLGTDPRAPPCAPENPALLPKSVPEHNRTLSRAKAMARSPGRLPGSPRGGGATALSSAAAIRIGGAPC